MGVESCVTYATRAVHKQNSTTLDLLQGRVAAVLETEAAQGRKNSGLRLMILIFAALTRGQTSAALQQWKLKVADDRCRDRVMQLQAKMSQMSEKLGLNPSARDLLTTTQLVDS